MPRSSHLNDYRHLGLEYDFSDAIARAKNSAKPQLAEHACEIRHITAVGAYAWQGPDGRWGLENLGQSDAKKIQVTLETLQAAGSVLAPDWQLHTPNLLDGEDFLSTDYQTDALVLCYLFHPRTMTDHAHMVVHHTGDLPTDHIYDSKGIATLDSYYLFSHLTRDYANWNARLKSAKPKAIIAFGGLTDDCPDILQMCSKDLLLVGFDQDRARMEQAICGPGVPSTKNDFGMLMDRSFMRALVPELTRSTHLNGLILNVYEQQQQSSAHTPQWLATLQMSRALATWTRSPAGNGGLNPE